MKNKWYWIAVALVFSHSLVAQMDQQKYLNQVKRPFQANLLLNDTLIANNDIVFIGETHGFQANYSIAWDMIETYKQKTNFTYLLAEMDWATAQRLNQYLAEQDTVGLSTLMDESKGSPAWCKERYIFYLKLMALNCRSAQPIRYLGVDVPSGGIRFALEQIRAIQLKYHHSTELTDTWIYNDDLTRSDLKAIEQMLATDDRVDFNAVDRFEYSYQLNNLLQYYRAVDAPTMSGWDRVRDSSMFENYKKLVRFYKLTEEKMIGVWGTIHTYQQPSEGINWFAAQLNNQLGKRIHSCRIFYFDGKCMIPEHWLPGFLTPFESKKKLYCTTRLQNDDSWATGKKEGIKNLRKAVPKRSVQMFDLQQSKSPYASLPLLMLGNNPGKSTTDFFQTAIVVRNGGPTQPLGKNKDP